MTEKIMIIDTGFGETKITTVDGTKRNLVKNFDVDERSFYELAKRVYKRFENDKYDRVIVDSSGAGMALLDQLIPMFEKNDYSYDSKTGRIYKRLSGSITSTSTSGTVQLGSSITHSDSVISSRVWSNSISSKEEF